MSDKPKFTAEDGQRAATALLSFWKKGHGSLSRLKKLEGTDDDPLQHGKKMDTLEAEANKAKLNPDLMKKAWRLAQMYEKEDIEAICQRVRNKPAPFSYTHMVLLLQVNNKAKRKSLITRAIQGQWSDSDLQRAILAQKKEGRKAGVGRNPKVPDDPVELLIALEGLCLKWSRWCEAGKKKLPAEVKQCVETATTAVKEVEAAVQEKLVEMGCRDPQEPQD
jgi:hypothetical protein